MARRVRAGLLLLAGGLLALFLLAVGAAPAYAASDQVDSFDVVYTVQPSGIVDVKETIVYRFGDNSGRHGIERAYIAREPYDQTQDQVYTIENIEVTTPNPGVSTQFSSRTVQAKNGREQQLVVRIGDPDETISTPTVTYLISYELGGALRTSGSYDEFYWDATGVDSLVAMKSVSIKVTVPGGVQDTTCTTGAVGSTTKCDKQQINDGVASFAQAGVSPGSGVTIGTKITAGLIADNKPHLEPDGSKLTAGGKVLAAAGVGLMAIITIGSPIVGVLWWRRNGRDQRYAGLAPGTVPLAGQPAHVVPNDPDLPIPVAFSPPKVPVAEAGLLIDGQVDARETAATIIDLAVRGGLTVQSTGKKDFRVTLVNPGVAEAPHEMVLLNSLFDGQPPGAERDLSKQGSMASAHQALQTSVRNQVTSRGWFRKVPSATATGSFGVGLIAMIIFAAFGVGAWVLWIAVPLLPIILTISILRMKLRRGQRTPDGRAVCDQVEGFRTYLATAEAEQLQFEEGEDIFSKYLPWAIMFELADRWAKICGDLVAMGRLPDATPYWYVGNYHMAAFNTSFISSSLTSAAGPAPSSGSSGSGFGGGSSFSSGGFSGGGGGGGSVGSW